MYSFRALLASLVVLPSILATAITPRAASGPKVTVKNGTYTGVYSENYNQDFFLGIPYAQPPVGDLRYRVAQPLDTKWKGSHDASQYSCECVGYGSDQWGYDVSEDCLYLNVIRPATVPGGYGGSSAGLPVAIWIHGGGYFEGGGPDKRYNLSFILDNSVTVGKPFIGVSINYRLSGWGFLASNTVSGNGVSNLGLRDQRLALQWVQENIAAFGGDPKKVTIWGESAGASSVGFHLVAYNGRDDGLFRSAIMESGSPVLFKAMYGSDYYEPLYDQIVDTVGCAQAIDTLGCLRTVPFDSLNNAINTTASAQSWFPVVDGDFIQKYSSIELANNNFVKVPILIGANTDEGTAFAPYGINTPAEFVAILEDGSALPNISISSSLAQDILAAYPDNPCVGIPTTLGCTRLGEPWGSEYRRVAAYAGDAVFIAARRLTAQVFAAAGLPVYSYRFNAIPNGLPLTVGATHFQEVAFVFDNTNGVGYDAAPNPFGGKPKSYFKLAKLMSNSWVSFIVDNDPNTFRAGDNSIAQWPAYTPGSPKNFVFDTNVTSYPEADTWRRKGIALINSANLAFHR